MSLVIPPGFSEPKQCTCGPDRFMRRNKFDFVPDHLFGLDIKIACCIHDYMYRRGVDEDDRTVADRIFYDNMLYLIDQAGSNWFVRSARKAKAWLYYQAVRVFGGPNFRTKKSPAK